MSQTPPGPDPNYAPYYRPGSSSYGTADKLQALADGYFGLNNVFVVNVLILLPGNFASRSMATSQEQFFLNVAGVAGILLVVVALLSYPQNKKIGIGKDWPPSNALLASILMGLNSAFCCGIIGYIVMQSIAMKEMKLYGLQGGFFGLKKKDVQAKIAAMRASPGMTAPPPNFQA